MLYKDIGNTVSFEEGAEEDEEMETRVNNEGTEEWGTPTLLCLMFSQRVSFDVSPPGVS